VAFGGGADHGRAGQPRELHREYADPPPAPPTSTVSPAPTPIADTTAAAVLPATGSVLAISSLRPYGVCHTVSARVETITKSATAFAIAPP